MEHANYKNAERFYFSKSRGASLFKNRGPTALSMHSAALLISSKFLKVFIGILSVRFSGIKRFGNPGFSKRNS
jgi:hypothetical protein